MSGEREQSSSDDRAEEALLGLGRELSRILEQHLVPAFQPILASVGQQVEQAVHRRSEPSAENGENQDPQLERETRPIQQSDDSIPYRITEAPVPDRPPQEQNEQGNQQRSTGGPRYAQLLTTVAKPGLVLNPESTARMWEEQFAPMFRDAEGFCGAFVLGNPGSSRGITITLWDTEQHAMTSRTLEQMVAKTSEYVLGEPTADTYEVVFAL